MLAILALKSLQKYDQVESTSDTTISTANTASDSDSGPELIITRKIRGRSELLTNTYERKTCVFK